MVHSLSAVLCSSSTVFRYDGFLKTPGNLDFLDALWFILGPRKKELPEIKNGQETLPEYHVTKKEAPEKSHLETETAKTESVLMKVLMADQKTEEALKSVKRGKYNWLYIQLIFSFQWSCILWFSLQLFKGTPMSSTTHWSN